MYALELDIALTNEDNDTDMYRRPTDVMAETNYATSSLPPMQVAGLVQLAEKLETPQPSFYQTYSR